MNDQQAAEYMAGIESAIQAARWALPVDFARDAYAERFAVDGEPHADLEISGDHRPRHRHIYARNVPRWEGPTCRGCGGSGFALFSGFVDGSTERGYAARCPACNGHGREPSE